MITVTVALIPVIILVIGIFAIPQIANTKVISDLIDNSNLTGWQKFPFNFRIIGYDKSDVERYWNVFVENQDKTLEAFNSEEKALKIDLLFPLFYGLTTIFSCRYLWLELNQPFSSLLIIAPMVIAMIADWIENTTTLKQLALFRTSNFVDASQIKIASFATQVKLISFIVAYLILFSLAIALLFFIP